MDDSKPVNMIHKSDSELEEGENEGRLERSLCCDNNGGLEVEREVQKLPDDQSGCLSCFSFFNIPPGTGFKLFEIFGKKRDYKNPQNPEQKSAANMKINEGTESTIGYSGTKYATVDCSHSEMNARDNDLDVELKNLELRKISGTVIDHQDEENLEGEEEVIEVEIESAVKLDTHGMYYCPNCNVCITKVIFHRRKKREPVIGCLSCFSFFNIPTGDTLSTKSGSEITETEEEATKPKGDDRTTLAKPGPVEPEQNFLPETEVSKTLDILKSIVYGGLMESIASLSIVSSAVATDATTLNILALGLANLIGGLFIIGNNLRELKNDHPKETSKERNEEAGLCYEPKNFLLHATVAMLSFLVFGLIAPLTYGFSFRKSDDRDLKLVAVAAASLSCITILAFGKARIRKPPKFYMYIKTVVYYIFTAIAVSGVSYGVGDLIKKLFGRIVM